jgi:hypothetical protein
VLLDDSSKPLSLATVRNLTDWGVPIIGGTTASSIDLSAESLNAASPSWHGIAKAVALRIATTDAAGSVLVELQKYYSAAWNTVRSKTIAAASLTAGAWNDFVFDTGSGDRNITKTASLWRVRVTMTGAAGTGTTISSTSATRTTAAYRLFVTPLEIPTTDIDGRWRPHVDYPDNWKCMIGPWEIPAYTYSYTSGDYQTTAPGLKVTTPGDVQFPLPVRAGVATTVTVKCKQVGCNSARLPKLVAWGNGITQQTATKANDSNWETLTVVFTPAQAGVVILTARQMDYTVDAGTYSLWSDWAVSEA